MEELKYRKEAKQFIEDRGFSGIANQAEVEGLMSAFAHKLASDGDLADVTNRCISWIPDKGTEGATCALCDKDRFAHDL